MSRDQSRDKPGGDDARPRRGRASATVSEDGIEIERAPEGITLRAARATRLLGTLVGADEKFAAHNAALWEHGLLVQVPKGRRPRKAALRANRRTRAKARRALLAPPRRRRAGEPLQRHRGVRRPLGRISRVTRTPSSELFVEPGREGRVRLTPEPLRGDLALRAPPRARRAATPSSTGSPAASAPRRARRGSRTTSRGAGATSRVTGAYFADGDQHLDYDTFQEHIAPNTTSDFAFKGALRDHATAVWRGMIRSRRTRRRRTPTRRTAT